MSYIPINHLWNQGQTPTTTYQRSLIKFWINLIQYEYIESSEFLHDCFNSLVISLDSNGIHLYLFINSYKDFDGHIIEISRKQCFISCQKKQLSLFNIISRMLKYTRKALGYYHQALIKVVPMKYMVVVTFLR